MLDYLSRINVIQLCTNYNDLRTRKLKKSIYQIVVLLNSEILQSDGPFRIAEQKAIPQFRRFNIIECEVRNVI